MKATYIPDLKVQIDARRITYALGSVVIGLAAAHVLVHLPEFLFGVSSEQMITLKRFFNMGVEANLPTYISALFLLLAGGLLALIAGRESNRQQKQNWHWWGLAIGFVLMSFDEAAMIHEGLVSPTWSRYIGFSPGRGIMRYDWYKLYIPIVLLIGLLYVPFLLRLPRRYSLRLLLAGAVFLSGAIGFEMVESYLVSHDLRGRGVSSLFEEVGEMLGVVLAIQALLLYLADNHAGLVLGFRNKVNPLDARVWPRATERARVVSAGK